jgi:hypothetical protein
VVTLPSSNVEHASVDQMPAEGAGEAATWTAAMAPMTPSAPSYAPPCTMLSECDPDATAPARTIDSNVELRTLQAGPLC